MSEPTVDITPITADQEMLLAAQLCAALTGRVCILIGINADKVMAEVIAKTLEPGLKEFLAAQFLNTLLRAVKMTANTYDAQGIARMIIRENGLALDA